MTKAGERLIKSAKQAREMVSDPAEGFEVFSDPTYWDMWCLRPVGATDFNDTIHFADRQSAVHASHVIVRWFNRINSTKE